jgi:hypothetical protein
MTPAASPSDRPVSETLRYRGFHPFLFSTDEDVRAKAHGRSLDMREESRVLHLARDCYARTKRWVGEANRKEEASEFLDFRNLSVAPRERASFMPRDRLALEVERHEDLYNPDPIAGTGASGKLPPGIVFLGVTDLREAVANFDLVPFVEAYVRRLSALAPDYVWQFGDHHYYRTNGYVYKEDHWEPRRFPVPKQVVQALGAVPMAAPAACVICGKADDRVAPTVDPARPHAHVKCFESGEPARPPEELKKKVEEEKNEEEEAGKYKFRFRGD